MTKSKIKPNQWHGYIKTQDITRKNGATYTKRLSLKRFFYPDEWMAFIDNIKPSQKPTFMFLINTGARINEVRNIQVSDVDLDRQSIFLRTVKQRNIDGKRKTRTIPISSQFTRYLRGMIQLNNMRREDYFRILSTSAANKAQKKTLKLINIPDYKMISIHNIRKTFETWLLAIDIDFKKVTLHLGHTQAVASEHYVSPDAFTYEEKDKMRKILGDLYIR